MTDETTKVLIPRLMDLVSIKVILSWLAHPRSLTPAVVYTRQKRVHHIPMQHLSLWSDSRLVSIIASCRVDFT